jgi:hypothetical protein
MPKASEALIARRERRTAFFEVMRMLWLKIVALLALALFLAPALVIAHAAKPRDALQDSSTYQWSDLSSLSVEDINRRTLKAAAAIRDKHTKRWLAIRLAR